MCDKDKDYGEIPPLIEITDRRDMTVGELLEILRNYPTESLIFIKDNDVPRHFIEIKDVTPIYNQDTGKASPTLYIGKMDVIAN